MYVFFWYIQNCVEFNDWNTLNLGTALVIKHCHKLEYPQLVNGMMS